MNVREQDYFNAQSLADLRDIVTHRSVELQRKEHEPLDEREIWWALEATLRLLADGQSPSLMI